MRVDVVVPVFNRWELTRSCLAHLDSQTLPHTAVVVDNGSTDGTPERVRERFPNVRLVQLPQNSGFPAACNRGAREGTHEVIALVNNDVECPPDFLEHLVAPLSDGSVGSVAALLLIPGEKHIESFGLAVDPTLAGYPRLRGSRREDAQTTDPILLGPSGAAGAYRRTAWEEVGGLDEGVFAYAEDVDLALRLRAAGWETAATRSATAVHIGSASAGTRSQWQRRQGGFARGYFLRRYGVLRGRYAPRALVTETLVVVGDAVVFSHDLAALRGRVAGWRAARGLERVHPPAHAIDRRITFLESVKQRLGVYSAKTAS
jgi:GT2 family glycosyltransferase